MNATDASAVAGDGSDGDGTMLLPSPPPGYQVYCTILLALCSVAAVCCIIVILAMTLPLLSPDLRKAYSKYNLYLAYLAIPDLIFNTYVIYLILAHQLFWSNTGGGDFVWIFDHPYNHSIFAMCVADNLYTNAFLTHEIFMLLQNSFLRKRHRPPTIEKVTKQALLSYAIGFLAFWLDYFFGHRLSRTLWKNLLYQFASLIFWVLVPIGCLVSACWKIYSKKLYVATKGMYRGRLKVLVLYFARIVFSDLFLWLPGCISYMVYWLSDHKTPLAIFSFNTFLLCASSQAVVNFGCSLTKPDAKQLIVDFLRFRYCLNPLEISLRKDQRVSVEDDPYLSKTFTVGNLASRISSLASRRSGIVSSRSDIASRRSDIISCRSEIASGSIDSRRSDIISCRSDIASGSVDDSKAENGDGDGDDDEDPVLTSPTIQTEPPRTSLTILDEEKRMDDDC